MRFVIPVVFCEITNVEFKDQEIQNYNFAYCFAWM